MAKNVKVPNIFFVILAVTLILAQFQVFPAFAELTFSTTKITVPDSDRLGWSVHRLDDGFAVGEPFAGSDSGLVHIFDSNGTQLSTIENPGTAGDNFGYSMKALGNVLAVGAPGQNGNSGMVYLFDNAVTPDTPISIPNPSGASGERMGEDQMNFFDNDLLVGISKATNDSQPSAGVIYKFSSSDGSTITQYDNPNGINANDLFGRSITVDEPLIITGAHGVSDEEGEAYVFSDSTTVSIDNTNTIAPKSDDRFGWSTETTSSAYIVSAPRAEVQIFPGGQIAKQGVVYLHHKYLSIIDVFTSPDGSDINSGQNIEDQFGFWIAESNNLILVGAPFDDVEKNGTIYINAGSAYLFENNAHVATFNNPDPANGDLFGYSVDILDGQLIFGAPGDENNAGAVYYAVVSNQFAARLDIVADPNPAIPGSPITFTYTITNIGEADLESADADPNSLITLVDDSCADIVGPDGNIGDAILYVGESWTFTCTKQAPSTSFTESANEELTVITFTPDGVNTQTMTCTDPEFSCNPLEVNVASSGLDMTISANPNPAQSGQTVNVDFDIVNTGTIGLFIDGTGGVVDNNANCVPIGESPDIFELAPGLHTHFTCDVIAASMPIDFDAVVTATNSAENPISATDQYTLGVISITLEISAQPDPTYIGTLTTVIYNVTNTGSTSLTIDGANGVVESIAGCTPFTQNSIVTIQSGEFIVFTCDVTGAALPINFDATATAFYQGDIEVLSNSATFTLNSISPEITLAVSASPNPVNASSTTTLTAIVTNSGNSVLTIDGLTGIVDANNNCNPIAAAEIHTINPSQQLTFTCTVTAGSSEIDFDLTATALDENGNPVSDQQLLNVGVASLDLVITSVPSEPIPYGGTPVIIFTVINNGTVNFTDILFDEILNSSCIPVGPSGILTPGQSRDYQCTIPTVIQDISLHGMATGIYDVGQFVKQQTITLDVLSSPIQLFCGLPESAYDKVIHGTNGNDNLVGTNGNDLIIGNNGNDKIKGKDGNDCIIGADGDDKIWGGKGNDTIEGNAGKDQIHGQDGDDIISGADGDDKIWGGKGNDTIDAGIGNDRINANQGDDNVIGGDGNDWISAGIGNDIVNAGLGDDKIFGRQGNDNLFGEAGNDIIHGGQGNDLLNGGPNNDQCHGAQGTNTFVDCESQKPMKEENEETEEEEEHEDNDNGNDNNGNHENDKDNKNKKN